MQINRITLLVLFIITAAFYSCTSNTGNTGKSETENKIKVIPRKVSATVIKPENFAFQILSNGIVKAGNRAELFFETTGVIKKVNVHNGSKVQSGEVLAVLYNGQQLLALEKARETRKQAITELNSLLIGYGGREGDTNSVNRSLLQSLKSQSGYNMAMLNLKSARMEYENTFLKAPFSGVVANLSKQQHDRIDNAKPFCILLDNEHFIVDFDVMEQDVPKVNLGQKIKVMPVVAEENQFAGTITEINPVVDKNGLVNIKAGVSNQSKKNGFKLLSGMNVKIIAETVKQGCLIIPKSALVLRDNKKVVFTYSNGKAKWNYVETAAENSTSYLIANGLKSGDTVITDGALNLAHDAEVELTDIR